MEKTRLTLAKIRIFLGLLVVAFFLVFLERSGAFNLVKSAFGLVSNPVQISVYRTYQNFTGFVGGFVQIGNLRTKEANLEIENATLQAEIVKLKNLEAENAALRAQLGTSSYGLKTISTANIIGLGTGGVRSGLTLDRGSNAGLKKGDLVVVKNIYLGKVVELSPASARVQLLNDPATKIPAQTDSGALGLVVGRFGTEIALTNVVQDDQLAPGQLVTTAGDAALPKGLVLGKLISVKKVSRELFQEAILKTLLDPAKLTTVFVMRQ